jgi:predicted HAD superfamily phosphohydrolase YqeG
MIINKTNKLQFMKNYTKIIIIADCDGTIRHNKNPFSTKIRQPVVNDLKKLSARTDTNVLVVSNNWLLSTANLNRLFGDSAILDMPALSKAHKPKPEKTIAYLSKLPSLSKTAEGDIKHTPIIVIGNSCGNDLGLAKSLHKKGYNVVGSFLTPLKSEMPYREMKTQAEAESSTKEACEGVPFETKTSHDGAGFHAFVTSIIDK